MKIGEGIPATNIKPEQVQLTQQDNQANKVASPLTEQSQDTAVQQSIRDSAAGVKTLATV